MRAGSTDRWQVPVQCENPLSVQSFDVAVEDLVSLSGDPLSAAEAAVAADDSFVLGHIVCAYLLLYATSAGGVGRAALILDDLEQREMPLDEREMLHCRAARAWASGDWGDATHWLERALLHEPRDLLALKVAQDLYFFLGETIDLRGVVARVMSSWRPEHRGWGYVQGMYAFGLEENDQYREADEFARLALDANEEDVWATHALAHVFEMEGRIEGGIAFLRQSSPSWRQSYFAIHNWWHLALYHLERGEPEVVLDLYDDTIRASRSCEWLDVVDAASLLWRLSLFGVEVRERARALATDIETSVGDSVYVFNDWHSVMTFGLAGRPDLVEQVIRASHDLVGSNRAVVERVGLGLLEGFGAFAAGNFDQAVALLAEHAPTVRAVGGSNAQRDIIDLTLITAAARSGQADVARALVAARVRHKASAETAAERLLQCNTPNTPTAS